MLLYFMSVLLGDRPYLPGVFLLYALVGEVPFVVILLLALSSMRRLD